MPSLFLSLYASWALLILRIALGMIFIAHGWPKIKNLQQTATNFHGMGFRPGKFWGTIAAVLEFFGGIALIVGLFTMLLGGLFVVEFAIILGWKLRKNIPLVNGWELDLIIFAGATIILALGAGAYSFDRLLYLWL